MGTKIFTMAMLTPMLAMGANRTQAQPAQQETELTAKPKNILTLGANYTGDIVNNLSGGIRSGSAYLGMAQMSLTLDTQAARLWKGGQASILWVNTHGDSPSEEMIGDLQGVSNIEAGNHTYLQECWIKQTFGPVELTVGLQDMAVDFSGTDYGALYLNSSFGIRSSISHNIPAPIFPLTNLGLTVKWDVNEYFSWLAAIYDGTPEDFDRNPYNLRWKISGSGDMLAITEVRWHTMISRQLGTYKAGILRSSRPGESGDFSEDESVTGATGRKTITSFYCSGDQVIWSRGERSLGCFFQWGYCPSDQSVCNQYAGFGLNFAGISIGNISSELGLAVAHENFKRGKRPETAVELTWKLQLLKQFYVQPDFQYVIHPARTAASLDNAFCANIRFGLSF